MDILRIPGDIVAIDSHVHPNAREHEKANVFVDMSGWAPKYFPPAFAQYARTLLQDKMLFGSDWPMLTVERWQKEFAEYNFPDNVVRKIMLENAKRVLRLEQ